MICGIIPSRYASTRFPGKPLTDLGGKTMIQRVYEQALQCPALDELWVATDDARIYDHVLSFGGKAVMTAAHHCNGTERCAEVAATRLADSDVVINIQGDEPFIDPLQIAELISCFQHQETELATLIKEITRAELLFNPNVPKVVVGTHGQALYFSRAALPYQRDRKQEDWLQHHNYYKHIGIYGYRAGVLQSLVKLGPTPLELSESLEQLRWLEHGYRIQTKTTAFETLSIDTPEDLEAALKRCTP